MTPFSLLSVRSMCERIDETEAMSEQCTDFASDLSLFRVAGASCFCSRYCFSLWFFLFGVRESTYAKEQGGYSMSLYRYSAEDIANVPHDGTVREGGGG